MATTIHYTCSSRDGAVTEARHISEAHIRDYQDAHPEDGLTNVVERYEGVTEPDWFGDEGSKDGFWYAFGEEDASFLGKIEPICFAPGEYRFCKTGHSDDFEKAHGFVITLVRAWEAAGLVEEVMDEAPEVWDEIKEAR